MKRRTEVARDARQRAERSASTLAKQADRYALYQQAVQVPEAEVAFFERAYAHAYAGAVPLVLREDFCAAAAVCGAWVRSHRERRAYGVDIDPEPLAWGERHNLAQLEPDQRARVELLQQDVRQVDGRGADIVAAQNFSFFIFKTRLELRDYFSSAYRNLGQSGILVTDVMGGPDCWREQSSDSRRVGGFRYIWEQRRFDPITHECTFFIHFKFRDGSQLQRAFRYDWRLWTIPEIRELMAEVGFARSEVYWEGTDHTTGTGNGVYRRCEHAASDPSWVCYVVGVK